MIFLVGSIAFGRSNRCTKRSCFDNKVHSGVAITSGLGGAFIPFLPDLLIRIRDQSHQYAAICPFELARHRIWNSHDHCTGLLHRSVSANIHCQRKPIRRRDHFLIFRLSAFMVQTTYHDRRGLPFVTFNDSEFPVLFDAQYKVCRSRWPRVLSIALIRNSVIMTDISTAYRPNE
jgi:hypothetical protein